MRQYLAEGIKGAVAFLPEKRTTPLVQETLPNGKSGWRIPGRLSECDVINGNNRRYRRPVWEKNFQAGSTLLTKINECEAFGLLEHPKDGQVTLESPISHAVACAKLNEDGSVTGEIIVIDYGDNSPGRKLKAMIEQGYNPKVSSRGFGSLIKGPDGVDDVQDDYVCEGWDVVIKPSFETAVLAPDRTALDTVLGRTESEEKKACKECGKKFTPTHGEHARCPDCLNKQHSEAEKASQTENLNQPVVKDTPPTPAASPAPAPSAVASKPTQVIIDSTTMNINEVKSRIASLRQVDPSKLSPKQFAESVAAMAELHNAISAYVAEDPKRNYEGDKLHRELETFENKLSSAQGAPTKTALKLREDRNKVLHVCKNLVETALKWKNATAESLKSQASLQKLVETITTNGQGWMALANKRKARLEHMEKKYKLACECISVMTGRYNEDMATIGAHSLTLEFKEKITPEIQTALSEAVAAKNPKAVLAIREQLAPEETAPAAAPAATPATPAATAPAAAATSKPAPTAAAPVTENKPAASAPAASWVEETIVDPRNVNAALSIVERLSLASAK